MKKKECNSDTFDSEMRNLMEVFIVGIENKDDTLKAMRLAYNSEISRVNLIMRSVPIAMIPLWHDYKEEVKQKYNSFTYTVKSF